MLLILIHYLNGKLVSVPISVPCSVGIFLCTVCVEVIGILNRTERSKNLVELVG